MSTEIHRSSTGKRAILAALIASLVLVLPVVGCLAGGWYGLAWHKGTVVSWKPLPPLPSKASQILGAGAGLSHDSWVVYVKAGDQKTYACSPEACWLEKTTVPAELQVHPPCDPPVYFEVPLPPGRVVDRLQTQACHPEAVYQTNFAVLEDGSVWRWQHWTKALTGLERLIVSIGCGSMVGLLSGLVSALVILLRHKRRQPQPNRSFSLKGEDSNTDWPKDILDLKIKDNPDLKTVVDGNSTFAFDLYQKLKDREGNLFFCPHSLSTALAMIYAGAGGDTEKQIAQTLHFALDPKRLQPALAIIEARLKTIQEQGKIQLKIAAALWPQQDHPFLETFLSLLKENYGVSITPVDYRHKTEEARQIINTWVEEKTNDKVKKLITKGVLDTLPRLVLVNAIYFKGQWARQFDQRLTHSAPFWLTVEKSIRVSMMAQTGPFKYNENEGLQILELPYLGNTLSMMLLLPKKIDGLAELENSLTPEKLERWSERLFETEVEVLVPKFKLSSHFRLDDSLKLLGLVDAFTESRANFAGMDGNEAWLYIGAVIHQALVEVNEEGTEATAAAAVVMTVKGIPLGPPAFRADHPFVFLIRDNDTGSILFIGRVVNPGNY